MRKGTTGERAFALAVGFIAYGVAYCLLMAWLEKPETINYPLTDGILLVSLFIGALVSWGMALVILKVRK